jgi:transposase-like protein
MEERLRFVVLAREGKQSVTQLCAHFGISRKTGYKWLERYAEEGQRGCEDKSRAPHTSPHATPESVVRALVRLRKAHPLWGPKKLGALARAARAQRQHGGRHSRARRTRQDSPPHAAPAGHGGRPSRADAR